MASGWNLMPLGQAHPPTKEVVQKRTEVNKMMREKDNAMIASMPGVSPRFGQQQEEKFTS
jgi:hypothetical protein